MTSKGPFQPKAFYGSTILLQDLWVGQRARDFKALAGENTGGADIECLLSRCLCRRSFGFQQTRQKSRESFLRNTYVQAASCLTMCLNSHYHEAFGCCHPAIKSGMKSSLPDFTIIICRHVGMAVLLKSPLLLRMMFCQVGGTISPLAAAQSRAPLLEPIPTCPLGRPHTLVGHVTALGSRRQPAKQPTSVAAVFVSLRPA